MLIYDAFRYKHIIACATCGGLRIIISERKRSIRLLSHICGGSFAVYVVLATCYKSSS